MKKLRLLVTPYCNRNCIGCCNKDYDLPTLPVISLQEASAYDEIYLTGGEPLLFVKELINTLFDLRALTRDIKIYLYSAWNKDQVSIERVLPLLDGLTYTLHTQEDVKLFKIINLLPDFYKRKSYRLNVFKGIDLSRIPVNRSWKVKDNIEWIENCPLPKGETFARLENTYEL